MSRKWYEIKAEAGARTAEMWIYDVIGVDFWGDGVSAAQFAQDVATLDVDELHVHINSPGGSFFDGAAIHAALVRHPARVTSYVDGYAASAAWLIALAGNRVVMAQNAFMMFHKAYTITMGNDAELMQRAAMLTKVDDQQVSTGMARSSKSEEDMRSALEAGETWLNAEEAVEWGFADEVAEPVRAAALSRFDFPRLGIQHAPAALAVDTDTDGASDVVSDETGGAPVAQPEAYIPGFGYARF